MEWMNYALSIIAGLAATIPLVIKLVEYVQKAIREKNWGILLDMVMSYMEAAEGIGRIKRDNNVMILQSSRWNDIVERVLSRSDSLGLSREFMATLLDAIHIESINRQNKIMREK